LPSLPYQLLHCSYRAPWLKDIWFFGTSYIIPQVDTVVLGGTAGKGDWSTTVSLSDTKTILDNIAKVFPSIYDAPIVSHNTQILSNFP
jgi:hypothetical protein